MLKVDVSQFYPSLYTHAIGWAVDEKLRKREHWNDRRLLGKRLDQCLMNAQGKISQGIPIGPDISFLLSELVLAQIDRALGIEPARAFRWFDDYEISFDSRDQAENALMRIKRSLELFNLRINPKKTQIVQLPQVAGDLWHESLIVGSKTAASSPNAMVRYFDLAFELALTYPDAPLLQFAIGALFRYETLAPMVHRVAESCISQAMLGEPGCAQKSFALLKYWEINGSSIDGSLIQRTIDQIVARHARRGSTSGIAWALTFCISERLDIPRKACQILSGSTDDIVCILALHAASLGLASAFTSKRMEARLADCAADGPHWLALYESVRQGFLPDLWPIVAGNALLGELLASEVTFYRQDLKAYAMVLHSSGAPSWVAQKWIRSAMQGNANLMQAVFPNNTLFTLLFEDIGNLPHEDKSDADVLLELMGQTFLAEEHAFDSYQ